MEKICIIVQTAFFNKDNELIAIKYESIKMNKKFKLVDKLFNSLNL